MATLAPGASSAGNVFYGFESLTFTSNHGTYFRYTYIPTSVDGVTSPGISRSYGPAAQNLTIGPFPGPGMVSIYNEGGGTLTWNTTSPNMQFGATFFYGTMSGQGVVNLNPANSNVTISPTGTGTVTINPATLGNIDNTRIGFTARAAAAFQSIAMNYLDGTGTPGNITQNAAYGKVAIAAGASSVVVTNSFCTSNSAVFAVINQGTADATLTQIIRTASGAGSLTIYGNANATANTSVSYIIISN